MSVLLDPADRSRTGLQQQTVLTGSTQALAETLLQQSWRDFIYAEVWTRPGLDRRSRFWIAMASAACSPGPARALEGYIRGALTLGDVTLAELREGALHLAVYAGWSRGDLWDDAITRVAAELNLADPAPAALRAEPWDPAARRAQGQANFNSVMVFPAPPPVVAYFDAGIINFVFGEMWKRPDLDQRARRWITLVGVADSSSTTPIRSHTHAAMASGDATMDEMHEFVLQYAIHGGWPKASVTQAFVFEMGRKVALGLPWDA